MLHLTAKFTDDILKTFRLRPRGPFKAGSTNDVSNMRSVRLELTEGSPLLVPVDFDC